MQDGDLVLKDPDVSLRFLEKLAQITSWERGSQTIAHGLEDAMRFFGTLALGLAALRVSQRGNAAVNLSGLCVPKFCCGFRCYCQSWLHFLLTVNFPGMGCSHIGTQKALKQSSTF